MSTARIGVGSGTVNPELGPERRAALEWGLPQDVARALEGVYLTGALSSASSGPGRVAGNPPANHR
jgi:hypothetical protein